MGEVVTDVPLQCPGNLYSLYSLYSDCTASAASLSPSPPGPGVCTLPPERITLNLSDPTNGSTPNPYYTVTVQSGEIHSDFEDDGEIG